MHALSSHSPSHQQNSSATTMIMMMTLSPRRHDEASHGAARCARARLRTQWLRLRNTEHRNAVARQAHACHRRRTTARYGRSLPAKERTRLKVYFLRGGRLYPVLGALLLGGDPFGLALAALSEIGPLADGETGTDQGITSAITERPARDHGRWDRRPKEVAPRSSTSTSRVPRAFPRRGPRAGVRHRSSITVTWLVGGRDPPRCSSCSTPPAFQALISTLESSSIDQVTRSDYRNFAGGWMRLVELCVAHATKINRYGGIAGVSLTHVTSDAARLVSGYMTPAATFVSWAT